MSSSPHYETSPPVTNVGTIGSPGEDKIELQETPNTDSGFHQTEGPEAHYEVETEVSDINVPKDTRSGTNSPLYQTLEPPQQLQDSDLEELDVSGDGYAPAEYEAVTRRDKDTPLYQILEPPPPPRKSDDPEMYTNHVMVTEWSKHKSDSHVYQMLQPTLEKQKDYANSEQIQRKHVASYPPGGGGNRSSEGANQHDYRDTVDSTVLPRGSIDSGHNSSKRVEAFKLMLFCSITLIIFIMMGIAIAALVLALKNKPSDKCQCQDTIQELSRLTAEHSSQLAQLDMLVANGNSSTCQCPTAISGACMCPDVQLLRDNVDEIGAKAGRNEQSVARIERDVGNNAMLIDNLSETTARINATLSQRITSLASSIRDLSGCRISVEDTCTIDPGDMQCNTGDIQLQGSEESEVRPADIILSFACVSMNELAGLIAVPVTDEEANRVMCRCTSIGNILTGGSETAPLCGLVTTRCA